jgi:hypothetical protein
MHSTGDTMSPSSEFPRRITARDFLSFFDEIHSSEEFRSRLDEAELKLGRSEIINDLVPWKIDVDQIYLWENCTSTYSLLGRHRFGSLPQSKASIHGALRRAEALIELTGPLYREHMLEYLERNGPSSGRGIFDAFGSPVGFALDDFAFHKTKLIPLMSLVKSGAAQDEPNWDKFFESGFIEYKAYCFSKMKKNPGGSFGTARSNSGDSHRPGKVTASHQDSTILELDPFRGAAPVEGDDANDAIGKKVTRPVRVSLPKLTLDALPLGSIPFMAWLLPTRPEEGAESPGDSIPLAIHDGRDRAS